MSDWEPFNQRSGWTHHPQNIETQIADALGTAERGSALIQVALNARRAEQWLAKIEKEAGVECRTLVAAGQMLAALRGLMGEAEDRVADARWQAVIDAVYLATGETP